MVKGPIVKPMKSILIAAMLSASQLVAQSENAVVELSASQAVEMAMKNNHLLKSLDHVLKQNDYVVKSAATNFLPKASFNGTVAKLGVDLEYYGEMGQGFGALGDVFFPEQNYSIEFQIQQPIFTGFATLNGLRSAKLSHKIQQISNEKTRKNIKYAILQVYWGIVSLQKSKIVASEAIRQLQELTYNQEAMMEQGMSTEHDFLLTKASLAQARLNELKVNKSISSMKRQFAVLLGLPATSEIALTDTSTENKSADAIKLDSIVITTLQLRPDLKMAQLNVDMTELSLNMAKSSLYPTVVAGFTYGNKTVDPGQKHEWNYNWSAFASLNFTLLDWGDRFFKIKKEKQQTLAMNEIYKEKKATVEKEVIDAYYEVEQTRNELEAAKLLAEAREKAYNASVAKHDEGIIPMYELLDIHNSFITAKYGVLQASTNLELAVINLDMGGLGSSSSSIGN